LSEFAFKTRRLGIPVRLFLCNRGEVFRPFQSLIGTKPEKHITARIGERNPS
jgi:hypothetical protein